MCWSIKTAYISNLHLAEAMTSDVTVDLPGWGGGGGGGGKDGDTPEILKTAKFVPKKRQYSTWVSSKRVGILPIWIPVVKFNVSSVGPSSERNMSLVYSIRLKR